MADDGYRKAFGDNDESLGKFLAAMKDFDKRFCDAMSAGTDYTLKLEVHGDHGDLIHVRVITDEFRRPRMGSSRKQKRGGMP